VAGQDADHEDPESQRRAVGANLVRSAVGKVVIFYPKDKTCLEKGENIKSEETVRVTQNPIVSFDPNDDNIKEAVRDGQATIVDLGMTTLHAGDDLDNGAIAANSALYGHRGSAFSMKSTGQDNGAMLPPGTETSG